MGNTSGGTVVNCDVVAGGAGYSENIQTRENVEEGTTC